MAHPDWNESYAGDFIPWDSGEPDPHLVQAVQQGLIPRGRALEIGCGTGTNAVWLAQQGYEVAASDIAARAIELARAKAKAAAVTRCTFEARDFLAGEPLRDTAQFVFDRGTFHVFDEAAQQTEFASRVAGLLAPEGVWLSLIGSTEGGAREMGPPRRSARDIVNAIEPFLELVAMRAIEFPPVPGDPRPPRAWSCLWRRRTASAAPSTR